MKMMISIALMMITMMTMMTMLMMTIMTVQSTTVAGGEVSPIVTLIL